MRRIVSIFLAVVIMTTFGTVANANSSTETLVSQTVETLDNGDTITIELYECYGKLRTTKTGHKDYTYYNATGSKMWSVTVNGTFTYTSGVSSKATSASATVNIYNNNVDFVSKNAYTSGSTATATATIKYNASNMTRSVSVSCDKNGNLS